MHRFRIWRLIAIGATALIVVSGIIWTTSTNSKFFGSENLEPKPLGSAIYPSIDPNFGPGMPTFNPEDPSTYWLAPENSPQLQGDSSPGQPFPSAHSDDSPNSSESQKPGAAGITELCSASITALPAGNNHQMLAEAQIKDLNFFTYARISWTGGAEFLDLEFLDGYARNAFLLKSEVPVMARIEISKSPDFAPESLICVANTKIKKVR